MKIRYISCCSDTKMSSLFPGEMIYDWAFIFFSTFPFRFRGQRGSREIVGNFSRANLTGGSGHFHFLMGSHWSPVDNFGFFFQHSARFQSNSSILPRWTIAVDCSENSAVDLSAIRPISADTWPAFSQTENTQTTRWSIQTKRWKKTSTISTANKRHKNVLSRDNFHFSSETKRTHQLTARLPFLYNFIHFKNFQSFFFSSKFSPKFIYMEMLNEQPANNKMNNRSAIRALTKCYTSSTRPIIKFLLPLRLSSLYTHTHTEENKKKLKLTKKKKMFLFRPRRLVLFAVPRRFKDFPFPGNVPLPLLFGRLARVLRPKSFFFSLSKTRGTTWLVQFIGPRLANDPLFFFFS